MLTTDEAEERKKKNRNEEKRGNEIMLFTDYFICDCSLQGFEIALYFSM